MRILLCSEVEEQFSSYLDSSLSGAAMAELHEHMAHCHGCTHSFAAWQATLQALTTLAPEKAPVELSLRLRLALSHEKERSLRSRLERLRLQWENTIAPLVMRGAAGLASAVLLLGGLLLLVGTFATPEPATARDEPIGTATQPKLLYVAHPDGVAALGNLDGAVVVRVFVDEQGRVYDYRVLSGNDPTEGRAAIAERMMWSVFEPARAFGEPIPGSTIVSLAGVSVPG